MIKHIGIVAVSPEGSALCYRTIFRHATRLMGDSGHPVVTMHNEPFEQYVKAVLRDDWHSVAELLRKSADVLIKAGAEVCIVPDNLMQHGVHLAQVGSGVPWLTMADLVCESIERDSRKVVGLVGTNLVMAGSTYQTPLGLRGVQVLVPEGEDATAVDRIIFGELVYGRARPESRTRLREIIVRLEQRGCEGVILGSSEIPLLFGADESPLPVYDPTALLAEGAVRMAMEG